MTFYIVFFNTLLCIIKPNSSLCIGLCTTFIQKYSILNESTFRKDKLPIEKKFYFGTLFSTMVTAV